MIVATNNKGKLEEIRKILSDYKIYSLKDKNLDIDVVEDEDTFIGNAKKKAIEIYNILHEETIADDSGLCINCLDGFPGVMTHRFLGDDATDKIEFQKKVLIDSNTKRIDAYIPETKVLIEQKSFGKALDKKIHNSGDVDLTPYEQAKRYNDNLPYSEKARYIVTSNFAEIWIYDMNLRNPESDIQKINFTKRAEDATFIYKDEKQIRCTDLTITIEGEDA